MAEEEKQLLLLGPLLSVRKAAVGMLTPAEYKIFWYGRAVLADKLRLDI